MKSTGVLVKLAGPVAGAPSAMVGLAPPEHEIKPLFTISADQPTPGQAIGAGGADRGQLGAGDAEYSGDGGASRLAKSVGSGARGSTPFCR